MKFNFQQFSFILNVILNKFRLFEIQFLNEFRLCLGNYSGWKATCIGNNSSAAVSILKQEYKEGEMTLENVKDLSMKVLSKTLDMTKLTSDKIELATLRRVDGKTKIHILTAAEMDPLIAKFEAAEKEADEAKKAAEASKWSNLFLSRVFE